VITIFIQTYGDITDYVEHHFIQRADM